MTPRNLTKVPEILGNALQGLRCLLFRALMKHKYFLKKTTLKLLQWHIVLKRLLCIKILKIQIMLVTSSKLLH